MSASAAGLVALGLSIGCSHYTLGTGANQVEFERLYIAPITNEAALPQAVTTVTRALRTAVMQDGRVQLAQDTTDADAVLEVTLSDYARSFSAVQANDTALARKFNLELIARCNLTDQRTGKVLFKNRRIMVTRQIFVDDGQNPAEYQALPLLADQLADQVTHAVLDVW